MRRRRLLALAAAGVLAGCGDRAPGPPSSTPDGPETAADASSTPAGTPFAAPRAVRVTDLTGRDRFVTVVVSRDGRDAFAGSRAVPAGESVTFESVVDRPGGVDLLVETADGARVRTTWTVDRAPSDLHVTLGDRAGVQRLVRCLPTCRFAAERPTGTLTDAAPSGGDTVYVDGTDTPTTVEFALRSGAETLVAGAYRLPPAVRVAFETGARDAGYVVSVATERRQARYWWNTGEAGLYVGVTPGEPVRFATRPSASATRTSR